MKFPLEISIYKSFNIIPACDMYSYTYIGTTYSWVWIRDRFHGEERRE
jgi:hypothetical protein